MKQLKGVRTRAVECCLSALLVDARGLVTGYFREQKRSADSGLRIAPLQRATVSRGIHFESHPRASIATIVKRVIQQSRMTPDRGSAACRPEIRFRSHGILV